MKIKLPSNLAMAGGLIMSVTLMVNLLIFTIANNLGEEFLIPVSEDSAIRAPLSANMIIAAVIIASLLAILLYGFIKLLSPRGIILPFLSVSISAMIVSLGGPASLPDTDIQTKFVLLTMHFISALLIIGGLLLYHRQEKQKN